MYNNNICIFTIILISLFKNVHNFPIFSILFEESCDKTEYIQSNTLIIKHNIITSSNMSNYIRNIDDNSLFNNTNNNTLNNNETNKNNYTLNNETNKNNENNKNNDKSNILYIGIITIKYKTLSHCIYECNLIVIANKKSYNYVQNYMINKYNIGWILPGNCSNKNCIYKNGRCTSIPYRDEL